jgi:hypothetical protein
MKLCPWQAYTWQENPKTGNELKVIKILKRLLALDKQRGHILQKKDRRRNSAVVVTSSSTWKRR